MKGWQKHWLINQHFKKSSHLWGIIMGWVFISSPGFILGQDGPPINSENSSVQIDFTQSPASNDQANVVSTSQGLMPLRQDVEGYYVSGIESIPLINSQPFMALTPVAHINNYHPGVVSILLRFSSDQVVWSNWQKVEKFHDDDPAQPAFIGNMIIADSTYNYFSYMIEFKQVPPTSPIASVSHLQFNFFSPGNVTPLTASTISGTTIAGMNSECGCDLPAFATRADWNCPDGNNPSCASPDYSQVSHQIVHHSAGINSSNNWAAVVLSIWDSHVNINGWCDIGYNWIIDPNGIIYEGRGGGNNVKGAHFCGKNTGTMGICMLGNFENATPSPEALASLNKLLTWKSCDANISPTGSSYHMSSSQTLMTISGHRDGCATVCPGGNLYPLLPSIRTQVKAQLDQCKNGSTHIDEDLIVSNFRVFPNPNQGTFQVYWESEQFQQGDIVVYNSLGQELHREIVQIYPGIYQKIIRLGNLPDGVYQLRMKTPNFDLNKKLIVDTH
ncbi:MAG: N-acetylmuramoyl-L-alanine amidase [Bacteroidetes bacterium]|nr:N-acetylmuramoyl-L-alanine amidase [Bacteroidota bacterium]MCB0844132.1 N-acetylmuramoyl-L-alanine amidase [Bacteroidota bacterium]